LTKSRFAKGQLLSGKVAAMNRMTIDAAIPVVVLETAAETDDLAKACLPESSFVAIDGARVYRIYPWQQALPRTYADASDGQVFVRVHGFASGELARRWIRRQARKGDA
jgi:hypothetical protein